MTARRRINGRKFVMVLCGMALMGGFTYGYEHTHYGPEPGPPAVCGLLRPELVARLIPDVGQGVDKSGVLQKSGHHWAKCEFRGAEAKLYVAVTREGQRPELNTGLTLDGWHRVKLGDEAIVYGPGMVEARLGSYFIATEYIPPKNANRAAVGAATIAVTQEVLAQL